MAMIASELIVVANIMLANAAHSAADAFRSGMFDTVANIRQLIAKFANQLKVDDWREQLVVRQQLVFVLRRWQFHVFLNLQHHVVQPFGILFQLRYESDLATLVGSQRLEGTW